MNTAKINSELEQLPESVQFEQIVYGAMANPTTAVKRRTRDRKDYNVNNKKNSKCKQRKNRGIRRSYKSEVAGIK